MSMSYVLNWRPGNFFYLVLMTQSHKRNRKPFESGFGISRMAVSNQSDLLEVFSPGKSI
jgi:hypothetical protein